MLQCLTACNGQETNTTNPITPIPKNYTSWVVGDTSDVQTNPTQGFVLMGGSRDVDVAMQWLLTQANGGDVIVLRASGSNGYNDYFFKELGVKINSCETILINNRTIAQNFDVARKIRNAEAVFIAGGNQADYVNFWKDTPVEDALNYLTKDKKVSIGGTSAGCAILGSHYFSALKETIRSEEALVNPYNNNITIGANDFLQIPTLQNIITDTHYDNPDRKGRHTVFLARLLKDFNISQARGIGVEEQAAVLIANNQAAVVGINKAYFIKPTTKPEVCENNTPLTWEKGIEVVEIQGTNSPKFVLQLSTWQTTEGSQKTIKIKNGVLSYQ